MTHTKKILAVFGILFILGLCAYALSQMQVPSSFMGTPPDTEKPVLPPPLTDAVKAQLAASKGFQALISYTNRGFEPKTLTIKKGETVRFTNNSGEGLWVAATGSSGTIYPAGSNNECGQSAFDSCRNIARGEFWEFTFSTAGTWGYKNNTDTAKTGSIIVR